MIQSEESSSNSSAASVVLKSVNPFDYIKGRSRLERPADVVNTFREKLRLDETLEEEKLKKLLTCKKSKEFEKLFFESFHPVKDSKVFMSESFSEQKSSSRLMSPTVCATVLEWSLKPENFFIESVLLALINSGHVSIYTNSGAIIDKIIELKSGSLLLALLHGFTDLSDSGLTKLIFFMIGPESKGIFKKFEGSPEFAFNEELSIEESFFMSLLAMPKSIQLTKKYFLLAMESEIIVLLDRLMCVLKRFTNDKPFRNSSKCLFKAPNAKNVIEWLSVIVDSQYPLCLLQPNLLKALEAVNSVICEEVSLNSDLMQVLPSIKEVRDTKALDEKQQKQQNVIRITSNYVIEPFNI